MKRALVIGKGKSGKAADAVLRAAGYAVDFADNYDIVVASPGVPVKSELQLGCEALRAKGVKLLAVTGSKGKSSVVKLVTDAINGAGRTAVACGNYGVPVCDVAHDIAQGTSDEARGTNHEARGATWAVVEVSSFQLETTHLPPETFEAAAILNLQEDHLDRHGSVAVYHALKRSLGEMAKLTLLPETLAKVATMPAYATLLAGGYFDNEILRPNGAAAIALLRAAGLDDADIARAFREFEPLPHRMQVVGTFDGVRYVDDSKATSIAALAAGVTMAGHGVRLIAGGLDKGDEPKVANTPLTEWVKKVYLIGSSAEKLFAAWSGIVDCEICGTLDRAVAAAKREAVTGETVLLSPGAASFDQFNSFGERGDTFAQLVKK